jgi:hypothetical protein
MYIYMISLFELFHEFIKEIHPQLDADFYE